ncbi:hypothetical protein ONZ51_g13284 [Trametes cubensis]|uniref:XPG-I domain-containing protein n=1 Tax=Trametes cubensis TaxID=1111947 RepID=A0AAD7TGU7_9APHY|nr:hypothetical protein ONZ51_g13284 [Trametes cubensis]
MGIKGLWKILEEAAENHSLRTISIKDGFEARKERFLRVGVDVSIWIQQLQQVFLKGHAQAGENPELRSFFYRLAMLSERPIHVIFVIDGPLRPHLKRAKQVKTAPHWLTEGMQRFVHAFGFAWLEAAGEAEAELAEMNKSGIIDIVLTEDSDALVFGAITVARNPSYKRTDADIIAIYRTSSILQEQRLSRGDLLLFALLLGSDYDPSGLPRCGPTVALGLVRYGLGRSLFAALSSMSDNDLSDFLPRWRAQLRDKLKTDPSNLIGRRCPSLAASVPNTFPDTSVARLFLSPALLSPDRYADLTTPRLMDISRLGELCELYFTWGSGAEIRKSFRTTLWPGEATRMLILEGLHNSGLYGQVPQMLQVNVTSVDEPAAKGYTLCHAVLTDNGFAAAATHSLRGLRAYRAGARLSEDVALAESLKPLKVKIPALIVERARPLLVNPDYNTLGYQSIHTIATISVHVFLGNPAQLVTAISNAIVGPICAPFA